eukprot:CAMPEP_0184317956 /NCGR_PEP_ID=MMETSP1049-20130417/99746_1 /TAXON_ID=77928 /ORGANISM="Proteomonas sulcata, Strain CCMP704" /LENGTH=81 /DNA_ID=CAMNT_0026637543 /DNA_START=333 /DNA_END=575 /DNA_ORIENTATION=-
MSLLFFLPVLSQQKVDVLVRQLEQETFVQLQYRAKLNIYVRKFPPQLTPHSPDGAYAVHQLIRKVHLQANHVCFARQDRVW